MNKRHSIQKLKPCDLAVLSDEQLIFLRNATVKLADITQSEAVAYQRRVDQLAKEWKRRKRANRRATGAEVTMEECARLKDVFTDGHSDAPVSNEQRSAP